MRLSRLALPLLAVLLAGLPARAADKPVKLESEAEKAVLAELPADAVAEVAEIAAKLDEWKKQLEAAKKQLDGYRTRVEAAKKQVDDLKGELDKERAEAMAVVDRVNAAKDFDPQAVQDLLKLVLPLAEKAELEKKCPPFAKLVAEVRKIEAKVKAAEEEVKAKVAEEVANAQAKLKAVKADAESLKKRGEEYAKQVEALAALDEEKLRAMVEQTIRAKVQEEILAAVGKEALDALAVLKNPAQFAKTFADGEFKKWIGGNSLEITKELKARVITKDPKASLFAAKTDLIVEIEYSGGIKVQATGFGFKYDDTAPGFVKPFFDEKNATITADGKTALLAVLTKLDKLGDFFPDTLPVKITPEGLDEFKPGGVLRCGVGLDLQKVGLAGKLEGRVKISPSKIEADGAIKIATKLTTPIPLPGMPAVAIHEIGGELDVSGKVKKLKAEVLFASSNPGGDKTVAVQVAMEVTIPFKAVKIEGKLLVGGKGGQSVCDVEGTFGELADGRKGVDLTLIIPGQGGASAALKKLVDGKARMTITGDGLTANGHLALYQAFKTKFDLALLKDGSGRFTGTWDGKILGVTADAEITAEFKKGFTDLALEANFNLGVDLSEFGDLLGGDVVSVHLKVKDSVVSVTAFGFGVQVGFTVDLSGDLLAALKKALKEKVGEFVEKVADALKECDPFNKDSFAAYAHRNMDPFNKNSAAARFTKEFDPQNKDSKAYKVLASLDPSNLEKAAGIDLPDLPSANDAGEKLQNGLNDLSEGRLPKIGGKKKKGGVLGGLLGAAPPPPPDTPFLLALTTLIQKEEKVDEADFAARLKGAVLSLQTIAREEVMPVSATAAPGGRTVRRSKVHVRVIAPTLVAVDENTFVIGFVAKTSGAASTVQPGKTPERLSGSEAVGGNVKLTRQPDGKWKGKIEQTKLNWGKYCYQDLSLWLSRELERRLEYALPEVQIDGLRLFAEKTLTVHNATKSDLTVSLQLRTKVTAPKPVVKGLKVSLPKEWKWLPGDPDDDTAYQFKLKAGESKRVTGKMTGRTTDDPVTASRVQIWAEADDGEDWTTHYDQDFWLVPENPKKNNDREYQAEKAADARYTFHPKSGFRTYDERVIGFTNATAKPVRVSLDFRSSEDGKTTWRKLPEFEVPAGETVRPRDKAGQLVRASAVKFVAVSEQFGYREFQDKPLWVVAETDGLRLYKAEKVGTYTHTLKAVEAIKPGGDK